MDDSNFTLSHPAPLENAGSADIPIRTAIREPVPQTLRERARFYIILLLLILAELGGLGAGWWLFAEDEEPPPQDPLQVSLLPPAMVPPPPPPPPPPPTEKQKEPLPPLQEHLQSMQPRFEPLPEPTPSLKQKESPSKLAVAKDAKKEDKPVARVGVTAPGMGSGFFDKWLADAAIAMSEAYQAPPSERLLRGKTVVVIEFSYFNGARTSLEVLQSSGDPAVDEACKRAITSARLRPTPTSFIGRPVTLRVTMPVPKDAA